MSFPSNPVLDEQYTNAKGITFKFNGKGAWEIVSVNYGANKYTISEVAPQSPALTDQWYDLTQSVLKSWATDGDDYFWTPIGGANKNVPIVSETEPQGVEVGAEWYYQKNVFVLLEIDGIKQWVPVSNVNDVERAFPLVQDYSEESFSFEMFSNNYAYTWRDFGQVAITATTNGDDTIDVADTSMIKADSDYVVVSNSGETLTTVSVLSVLTATRLRVKTTFGLTFNENDGVTLSKTSFQLGTPGRAVVQNGDILFSKSLSSLRMRPGVVYIRRESGGQGTLQVSYRETGAVTWKTAPFVESLNVLNDSSVRDDVFKVDFTGLIDLRVVYVNNNGGTDTLRHMVLATSKQNIENNRVEKPTNLSPANGESNISATPTLTLSTYRSLYNIAQGGAEFKVAEDAQMTNVVYSSSTNFLAGWIATTGQTAAFNRALFVGDRNAIIVGDSAIIRITADGGKTFTPGASTGSGDYLDIDDNGTGRLFIVGTTAKLYYSDNKGISISAVTAPDGYAGDFYGVAAVNQLVVAVGTLGKIVRSSNGGTIFTSIAAANGYTGTFSDVVMNNSGTTIAVGANGEIQTSSNYGVDWVKRNPPGGYTGTYRSVALDDSGTAIAVGSNGAIHKSTDGGATWTAKSANSFTGTFFGIKIDQSYAVVVGSGGQIQTSSNLGDTWNVRSLAGNTSTQINDVVIDVELSLGIVFGESGLVQTSLRLDGAVNNITVPAGDDLLKVGMVYWWTGRYQDAVGFWSDWTTPTAFATQSNFSYVEKPVNTAPASNATNVNPLPTLQGSDFVSKGDLDTHQSSQWEISLREDFATKVYDSGYVTDKTQHTIPQNYLLANAGKYFYRVRYKGASGRVSPYSAPTSFSVVSLPNTPSITYPAANATAIGRAPTIQTSSYSIPGGTPAHTASQYRVATDEAFTSLVHDSGSVAALLSYTLPADTLNLASTYYVQARHRGEGTAWSSYSPTRKFTTIGSAALPAVAVFNDGKSTAIVDTIGLDTAANAYVFNINPTDFSSTSTDTLVKTTMRLSADSSFSTVLVTMDLANKDQNTRVSLPVGSYPTLVNLKEAYVSISHTGSLSGPTGFGPAKKVKIEPPFGEALFTSPGSFNWECPKGVFSVSAVAIGAGGAGDSISGKGGGGLGYRNNIAVTPGQVYSVTVGSGAPNNNSIGTTTSFASFLSAYGGERSSSGGEGGGFSSTANGGGTGGKGGKGLREFTTGSDVGEDSYRVVIGGGGGAAGYSGNGGNGGGNYPVNNPGSGNGGGGGGGGAVSSTSSTLSGYVAAGGGGVNTRGAGGSGARGSNVTAGNGTADAGNGGSSGSAGNNSSSSNGGTAGKGGNFGGGGAGLGAQSNDQNTTGGNGALRIIYGTNRSFPNNAA